MQAFIIEPTGRSTATDINIDRGVTALQEVVGGWVDVLPLDDDLILWLRDDHTGQAPNPIATALVATYTRQVHLISGTTLITGTTAGQTIAVTDAQLADLTRVTNAWRCRHHLLDRITQATLVKLAWL